MTPRRSITIDSSSPIEASEPPTEAQIVAFYLPQYHPIAENDEWWGEGFTDWTNVRRARALFDGHEQPKTPTTLGYYDLRDVEVHFAQAALARRFGVSAFCYYSYWFGGRRLLERPLDLVASNPDLAMPYAICWANEPWSRRWDGSENEILIEQRHSPDGDAAFIDSIAAHLADPRYLRVRDRPLLLIYRAGLLADPLRTTDGLRDRAVKLGLGDLFLAMTQTFGHVEPIGYGFDAAIEFPPHGVTPSVIESSLRLPILRQRSNLSVASFEDAIGVSLSRPVPEFPWFRTVMPGWDNTSRKGKRGIAYVGATPALFRKWLEEILRYTYLFRPPGERLVFVNAWNEWAEGAYLEPDVTNGEANLGAVRDALDTTATFALETAMAMQGGVTEGGLLEYGRRPWRGQNAPPPRGLRSVVP